MTSLADVVVSDPVEITGNSETVRKALSEAVTASSPTDAPAAVSPAPAPSKDENVELPEKFRGKSPKELVEMYQNLESQHGRMANDLGVQRQLTDRLLDLKRNTDLQKNTPPAERKPAPPVTSADLLDRPQETLERVVGERVASVSEDVNQRLARMEQSLAQQTFVARHPDYQSVVAETEFKSWLESSQLRLRAAAAANQGNWQIADELLSEFKTSRGGTRKTDPQPAAKPEADLAGARKASLETSGNAGSTDGKSSGGKKTYRRSDLIRLRIEDPDAYYDESFQNEIQQAHAEGRVK